MLLHQLHLLLNELVHRGASGDGCHGHHGGSCHRGHAHRQRGRAHSCGLRLGCGRRRELVSWQFVVEVRHELAQRVEVFCQTTEAHLQTEHPLEFQSGLRHRKGVQPHVDKGCFTTDGVRGEARHITDDAGDFFLKAGEAAHDLGGLSLKRGRGFAGKRSRYGCFALEPVALTHEGISGQADSGRGGADGPGYVHAQRPKQAKALQGGQGGICCLPDRARQRDHGGGFALRRFVLT